MLLMESMVIRSLAPPTQHHRAVLDRARAKRRRMWPRHRHRPSLDRELELYVDGAVPEADPSAAEG